MSRENVETVRLLIGALRSRDRGAEAGFSEDFVAAVAQAIDPEIEWDATRTPVDDLRGTFHGLSGVIEFWGRWFAAWDVVEWEEEITDAGDRVLVQVTLQMMRGKASGIEVSFPPYWIVCSFGHDKLKRVVFYMDEREALDAAGLSE